MELLIALSIGVMVGCGVYLVLRPSTFPLVVGITFLSYAVNVFLFSMGSLTIGKPAVVDKAVEVVAANHADPLPQALVLTAIVIAFGMTAFLIVLALRARDVLGNDHVDGLTVTVEDDEDTEDYSRSSSQGEQST